MERNVYRSELDQVHYTETGRAALADRLMEAQTPSRPARTRWVRRGLAAAAAAVMLVGSAVAVVGMPGSLQGWFARQWAESSRNGRMDGNQAALIERLTQEVGVSDTCGGVTVTLDSITAGDSGVWLMLNIRGAGESDDPYDFDRMDLEFTPDPDTVDTPGGYSFSVEFSGRTEDGETRMLLSYSCDLIGEDSLLKCCEGELFLKDLVCGDDLVQEGEWRLAFPLPPAESGAILTLDSIQAPARDWDTQEVRMIELRDIRISATDFRCTQSAEDQTCNLLLEALILKDGTEIRWDGGSSRWTSEAEDGRWASSFYWKLPVDVEQAAGLRFRDTDTVIPIN